MVPSVLSATKSRVLQVLSADPKNNVKFADVRFDCDNGSVIYYHNDLGSFSSSIDSNPPDRSLMFPDNSNNTDIFLVLENFLNNTQIPLCGSTVIVLTKRYTKINRSFKMNWKLLEEHVTVHFIQSNYMPYGGNIGSTNDISGFTGGLYVLTGRNFWLNDSTFPDVADKIMAAPYHQNLLFSYYNYLGSVNTTDLNIGSLKVPENQETLINATLAITTDITYGYDSYYFQSINLTLIDKSSYQRTVFSYGYSDLFSNSDLIYKPVQLKAGSISDVFMSYSTRHRGRVQIRMYIDKPLKNDKQLIRRSKEMDQSESFGVDVPNSLITF